MVLGNSMRKGWDWLRLAACAWGGLVLGLAVFGYLYSWSHTLYTIYAPAARNWWTGQDLYTAEGTAYYRYSPVFAIGMTPFALLPDSWGSALWRIVNGLAYAAGLWAWTRKILPADSSRSQVGAIFLLALPTSLHSMYNAQANLTMLGFILLGLAAAVENHWSRAAAWLALATLIKGYPLALALLLAVLYTRRFALHFGVALTSGLVLPFATQRPSVVVAQYASWLAHLRDSTTIMRERLRSLDHLFCIYGQPLSSHTCLLIQLLAGLIVLLLCLLHARGVAERRQQLTMTFLLFASWVVLFGPATETCTYVVMAPAIAWALVDVFRRPVAWSARALLVVSLLLMGPLPTDLVGRTLRDFANAHGSQAVGALLFLVYVLIQVGKSDQAPKRNMRPEIARPMDIAA